MLDALPLHAQHVAHVACVLERRPHVRRRPRALSNGIEPGQAVHEGAGVRPQPGLDAHPAHVVGEAALRAVPRHRLVGEVEEAAPGVERTRCRDEALRAHGVEHLGRRVERDLLETGRREPRAGHRCRIGCLPVARPDDGRAGARRASAASRSCGRCRRRRCCRRRRTPGRGRRVRRPRTTHTRPRRRTAPRRPPARLPRAIPASSGSSSTSRPRTSPRRGCVSSTPRRSRP